MMNAIVACFLSIFVTCNLFSEVSCSEVPDPVVQTDKGYVRGRQMTSRSGRQYFAFTSIPYAKPPVGLLRFERPIEADSWDGIYEGAEDLPECWQVQALNPLLQNLTSGQEDCLYLSVFTPKVNSKKKLPVMVYIYGGAFRSEFPLVGQAVRSRYLLDEDVVLVTFKYRVGAFGFMSLESPELSGNMGLKDSAMVLEWVNKNIASFGGDANSVTIFGNSAGGSTVHYLLISPMTKHLVHRAILQSGTGTALWALSPPGLARHRALTIAQNLGCPVWSYQEMISCLKQRPAIDIANSDRLFIRRDFDPICPFEPVIDLGPDSIVPVSPYQTFIDKPIIIGNTRDEGAFKTVWYLLYPELFATFGAQVLPEALSYTNSTTQPRAISNAFLNRYKDLTQLWTQGLFYHGTVEALKVATGPVYQYLFAHHGLKTSLDVLISQTRLAGTIPSLGISHTEELYYLFDFSADIPFSSLDIEISRTLIKLWTNFAKLGKPSWNGISWPEYDKINKNYLNISNGFEVNSDLWAGSAQFLESLPIRNKLERLGL